MRQWSVEGFIEQYDAWVERDGPSDDLRVIVMNWLHLLQSDPYRGATRRLDLGVDQWFAEIPDSDDGQFVATCLYAIDAEARLVRCGAIATLRHPVI